jgi:phosphotriesterase-related protein
MTVTGPIEPQAMGQTLAHEHVMVDFVGVEEVGLDRYDRETVTETVRPHLEALAKAGGQTLVECTPDYLGRDPRVLRRLARTTGVQILTNTGYYGAREDQHVPEHAYSDSVDALAGRWVREWEEGIGDTSVRPGFIKIGVDEGSLSDIDRKLVRAACRTHRETGLTIAVHTGPAQAAHEQLEVLAEEGVSPEAWIWVHAQAEEDTTHHLEIARRGGWVSLDGYTPDQTERYVRLVSLMQEHDLLDRLLLSHDNGWHSVGEPGGGSFAPYTPLFTELVPALRDGGLSDEAIQQILVTNPAQAFSIRPRTRD